MISTKEKLNYIVDNHFDKWLKTYQETENEISEKHSLFCICGQLATGLHETHCRKFKDLVRKETIKKLLYLIDEKAKRKITKEKAAGELFDAVAKEYL